MEAPLANGPGNGNGNGWKKRDDKPMGRIEIPGVIGMEASQRMPPHNLDAERGAIAACMLDPDACAQVVDILSPDEFFRDAHQVMFRAILVLAARKVAVDAVTVADELTRQGVYKHIGGDDLLAEVVNSIPHAANARYHADIVRQKAAMRDFIQSRTDEIRDAYSMTWTSEELLDKATHNLARIEKTRTRADDEFNEDVFKPWPDAPDEALWSGVAGKLIKAIEPHSEADPVATLGQFLVCVGNVVGSKPHWIYESTRHGLNLFLVVVGESAKSRKGTSWNHVRRMLRKTDEDWTKTRLLSGLSTGEGLIQQVRDPLMKRIKVGDDYEEREIDAGVQDKRALFIESEFASVLTNMNREGNNMASVIRQAWESGDMGIATKNTPLRATGAHVSIIGHITEAELHNRLTDEAAANGFGNRYLWVCARRSKRLPHGGKIHTVDFAPFVNELIEVLRFVDTGLDESVPLERDHWANQLWEHEYDRLTQARPGLLGAIIGRAEAQVMRVAAIYAVLDQKAYITEQHLKSGLALWKYCEQSAARIFGASLGDPEAESVLKALTEAGADGLTKTQLNRRCFSGRKAPAEMDKVLLRLMHSSLIEPPASAAAGGASGTRGRTKTWTLKK